MSESTPSLLPDEPFGHTDVNDIPEDVLTDQLEACFQELADYFSSPHPVQPFVAHVEDNQSPPPSPQPSQAHVTPYLPYPPLPYLPYPYLPHPSLFYHPHIPPPPFIGSLIFPITMVIHLNTHETVTFEYSIVVETD